MMLSLKTNLKLIEKIWDKSDTQKSHGAKSKHKSKFINKNGVFAFVLNIISNFFDIFIYVAKR